MPSWPNELSPQQSISPLLSAQECEVPGASCAPVARDTTAVGVRRSVVVPSPSWP